MIAPLDLKTGGSVAGGSEVTHACGVQHERFS